MASGSLVASPLLAWSSPAMILSSDDLPAPFGPTTPIFAPCRNERVTLSRTTLSPWALRTLRSVKTYSAMMRKPTVPGLAETNRERRPDRSGRLRPAGVRGQAAEPSSAAAGCREGVSGSPHESIGVASSWTSWIISETSLSISCSTCSGRTALRNRLVPRLRSWPMKLASTCSVVCSGPPSVGPPGLGAQPAVHDDRVALAHRVAHVVGEGAPGGHGVPGRLAVDPLPRAATQAWGHGDPEAGDAGAARVAVPDLGTDPAVEGHVGVVHQVLLVRGLAVPRRFLRAPDIGRHGCTAPGDRARVARTGGEKPVSDAAATAPPRGSRRTPPARPRWEPPRGRRRRHRWTGAGGVRPSAHVTEPRDR